MAKSKAYEKTNRKVKPTRKATNGTRRAKKPSQNPKTTPRKTRQKVVATLPPVIKYDDVGVATIADGGRLDKFWQEWQRVPYFTKFRKPESHILKSYRYWDHRYLMAYYGLKGFEFGNWVTQEDRMNYVCSSGLSLFDLQKVLAFPSAKNIGLRGKVGMAIGARGKGKALAHFEPWSFMINMTRYKTPEKTFTPKGTELAPKYSKIVKFLHTGGTGSLAHEYGHALDYFFGGFVDQDKSNFALTGGRSTRTKPNPTLMKSKSMRGITERLLNQIIWEKPGVFTKYYKPIYEVVKEGELSSYWIRRNELFARAFEQYVGFKLGKKKITNRYLTKEKYANWSYMDPALLKKVAPHFDQLIKEFRAYFRKGTSKK